MVAINLIPVYSRYVREHSKHKLFNPLQLHAQPIFPWLYEIDENTNKIRRRKKQ